MIFEQTNFLQKRESKHGGKKNTGGSGRQVQDTARPVWENSDLCDKYRNWRCLHFDRHIWPIMVSKFPSTKGTERHLLPCHVYNFCKHDKEILADDVFV